MFIDNVEGLSINWDAKNSNTFEPLTGPNPEHVYSAAGEYEVQIKGQAQEGTVFGVKFLVLKIHIDGWPGYEQELPDFRETYNKHTKISGIKYWGENGFTEINRMGGRITGNIPQPSRKSFIKLVRTSEVLTPYKKYAEVQKFPNKERENYILGESSKLLSNCRNLKNIDSLFRGCKGLKGSIPKELFQNCSELKSVRELFVGCSGLNGIIEEGLFDNCPKIKSFSLVFDGCYNLTGSTPKLWERSSDTRGELCFRRCTKLSNYSEIPSNWK